MKKNQPRQRPNQQLPQKTKKVERVAAEGRAGREDGRKAERDKVAAKEAKAKSSIKEPSELAKQHLVEAERETGNPELATAGNHGPIDTTTQNAPEAPKGSKVPGTTELDPKG